MAAQAEVVPFPAGTARFKQVVKRCGRPEVHLMLVEPTKDRALQELKRRNRVMTVRPARRGTGADYGVVGVFPERGVQFLVFGRSLLAFAGKRIVGIDYSVLNEAPSGKARASAPARAAMPKRPSKAPPSEGKAATAEKSKPARSAGPTTPKPVLPPTEIEVKGELRGIERLLRRGRLADARERVEELLGRMKD
ncbi:MAG TPA: hypothetical protein VG734_24165 [Lacunisphaera sp.]|nr:hypothetical protein [Lacunisphaera sp.]